MITPSFSHRFKIVTLIAAWCCIIVVAVLSLTPSQQMMRTGLSGHIEHVLAYAGTAFIATLAFIDRGVSRIIAALLVYAAALEFLQRFSPGRASSIWDFMFSGTGVLVGASVSALLAKAFAICCIPDSSK